MQLLLRLPSTNWTGHKMIWVTHYLCSTDCCSKSYRGKHWSIITPFRKHCVLSFMECLSIPHFCRAWRSSSPLGCPSPSSSLPVVLPPRQQTECTSDSFLSLSALSGKHQALPAVVQRRQELTKHTNGVACCAFINIYMSFSIMSTPDTTRGLQSESNGLVSTFFSLFFFFNKVAQVTLRECELIVKYIQPVHKFLFMIYLYIYKYSERSMRSCDFGTWIQKACCKRHTTHYFWEENCEPEDRNVFWLWVITCKTSK